MPQSARLVLPLLDWFAAHARDLPWRRTRDPYAIWVSEIMLQQTQVQTVIPYWERWLRELPDVQAVASAPEARLLKLWEGLGYYSRARNLQRAAQQIVERHTGRFPDQFAEVLALPGVGRYTAGALCSIAFNQPAPILDGNVIRVLARMFAVRGDPSEPTTREALWDLAGRLVQAAARTARFEACSALNQALMELGALVCTARRPDCAACPWRRWCAARRHGLVDELPRSPRRPTTTARHYHVFAIRRGRRWLVRQRPVGGVNAGLWEFPTVEVPPGAPPGVALRALLGGPSGTGERQASRSNSKPQRLGVVKCGITRYRLTLEAFCVDLEDLASARPGQPRGWQTSPAADGRHRRESPTGLTGVWKTARELERLAFSSGQRRILRLALTERPDAMPGGDPGVRARGRG